MVRTWRVRDAYKDFPPGSVDYQFHPDTGPQLLSSGGTSTLPTFSMADYSGRPYEDSPWQLVKMLDSSFVGVTGGFTNPDHTQYATAHDFIHARCQSDLVAYYPFGLDIPTLEESATNLIARTNPSRPFVNPGMLIQDIVTLPKLIFDIGRLLRSGRSAIGLDGVANNSLAAKFGWIPLFKDITDLLRVGTEISRRHDELLKLQTGRGLRRRLRLGEWTFDTDETVFIDSSFPLYSVGRLSVQTTVKRWGVVRWKSYDPLWFSKTDSQLMKKAVTIVHGGTASGAFASAWDLIPWTWLLGWFTNLRSYIIANGNSVPAYPTQFSCLMTEIRQKRRVDNISYLYSFEGGDAYVDWVSKSRYVFSSPVIQASLPYLKGDQLSTLSLLGVQRLR